MEKRYNELMRVTDEPRAHDDGADASGGSGRMPDGPGHVSNERYQDLPEDCLVELMYAMDEIRRRIAHPGYYRRLALQRIYDQPPEVLQAREEAGARVLAEYLASQPKS
jgi:hypothetical protein